MPDEPSIHPLAHRLTSDCSQRSVGFTCESDTWMSPDGKRIPFTSVVVELKDLVKSSTPQSARLKFSFWRSTINVSVVEIIDEEEFLISKKKISMTDFQPDIQSHLGWAYEEIYDDDDGFDPLNYGPHDLWFCLGY